MKNNEIKQLLKLMSYKSTNSSLWEKHYEQHDCKIKVAFSKKKILYPSSIELGDKTTSNFANSENFVVLECVNRLLEKGYSPDRIVLENKWALGRRNKGKLDILVKDSQSQSYLMIECKTYGDEYQNECKKMLEKGGQLFSYWQQDRNAKYLCLYTSELDDSQIQFENSIVKIEDEFRMLGDAKEVYDRWNKQFSHNGIFDDDVYPYDVRIKPLQRKDLKPLGKEDGKTIYNQFAEILRHNVVSDKGNAYNKIFNLFLCKILDEDKTDDEELEFQWIEGKDDEENLLSRLNDLYKEGMQKFLNKEITDYSPDDIKDIKATEKTLRIINELRLYKNQEFAFVDVFNKDSFLENAKIVIEIVKLLQGWQLRYTHKQQFLGEFFELLLNTGFKQESGQYFTPVPLVRFIIHSLPIQEIIDDKINSGDADFLPYVIDFACGSGHFLTEMMDFLQKKINNIDDSKLRPTQKNRIAAYKSDQFGWASDFIHGIERDYRLVKTSKLACFLHGDGEARIVHASGIDPFSSKDYVGRLKSGGTDSEQFDILVANPPYSISGFLSTVKEGDKTFDLYGKISDKSKDIELLFIERMKQLLKPGGLAGIILPKSILSNDGNFEEARKIIFENFEVRAIVVLGSKAFMATGVNTVIFFLKKRDRRVILQSKQDYIQMAQGKSLIVVKSGEKDQEKRFLGYEFSTRRGSEGIKLNESSLLDEDNLLSPKKANSYILRNMNGETIESIDESLRGHISLRQMQDLFDWDADIFSNKIFLGEGKIASEIKLRSLQRVLETAESGSRPAGGVSAIYEGFLSLGGEHIGEDGLLDLENRRYIPCEFYHAMNSGHVKSGDILICKDGARTGKCAYVYELPEEHIAVNEHVLILRSKDCILQEFLFLFMRSSFFEKQVKNLAYNKKAQGGLNKDHIKRIQVPLPDIEIQKEFIESFSQSPSEGGIIHQQEATLKFEELGLAWE